MTKFRTKIKLIFSISILLLFSACSTKPYVVKYMDVTPSSGAHEVYVVSHGWHTGFVVPADEIQSRIPEMKKRFSSSRYLEFGWGDKGFYQAKEITSGLTLQAIFWPTESVVHVVSVPDDVVQYFSGSDIKKICLNDGEYSSLISFISNSFFKDHERKVIKLKNGIYGNSQFYKGEGDYYLMNTCNKWTAKGLKSSGMDISTTFKLTASSVMDSIEESALSLRVASIENTSQNFRAAVTCR